jgi:sugar/nucleoside kinase (ribokinase family)
MTAGRILVVGDVMSDVIVIPEGPLVKGSDRRAQIRNRPGGSGANQAVWLGALGAPVTFAARVGTGDVAAYEAYLERFGVMPALAADVYLPSGVLVTIVDPDGERSFLTDRGANLNLCPADLPDALLDGVAVLLVSGYSFFAPEPREAVGGLVERARARGIAVAIDPASTGFLAEVGPDTFLDWTAGAEFIFANRDEAELLCGAADVEEQVRRLGEKFGTVIIKRGGAGAVLGGTEGVRFSLPAPQVSVIDSTGAGDAFAAGFLTALCAGGSEADALEAGIAAGARAVQAIGGQPGEPRRSSVAAAL